jgi:hypothetical protein
MDYLDEKGDIVMRRFLVWGIVSPDSFGLTDDKAFIGNNKSSKSQILVRIVSWDDAGYVCHWITDTQTDTQDYKLLK